MHTTLLPSRTRPIIRPRQPLLITRLSVPVARLGVSSTRPEYIGLIDSISIIIRCTTQQKVSTCSKTNKEVPNDNQLSENKKKDNTLNSIVRSYIPSC